MPRARNVKLTGMEYIMNVEVVYMKNVTFYLPFLGSWDDPKLPQSSVVLLRDSTPLPKRATLVTALHRDFIIEHIFLKKLLRPSGVLGDRWRSTIYCGRIRGDDSASKASHSTMGHHAMIPPQFAVVQPLNLATGNV